MFIFQNHRVTFYTAGVAVILVAGLFCSPARAFEPDADLIKYGERLVHNMDCNVCHTPKVFGPDGPPQWDRSRLLSGHPAYEKLPAVPEGQISHVGWGGLYNNGLTAWAGPWGISFGSNLTPDSRTGIGTWTEDTFIYSMRSGYHVGKGRPFLPPMPTYSQLTDNELHAIYSYLRSIPAVENDVPDPIPAQPSAPSAPHLLNP